jgi:hypothetical protein
MIGEMYILVMHVLWNVQCIWSSLLLKKQFSISYLINCPSKYIHMSKYLFLFDKYYII